MKIVKNQIIKGTLGLPMATDYIFPMGKKDLPIIIYTHGFNGFKDWGNFDLIAQAFAEAGFFFVKYNLSHNGTTLDSLEEFADLDKYRNNNYSKEVYDLSCVINTVRSNDFECIDIISKENVYLLGHSKGGAVAILGAQDSRIKKVVTWASIASCSSPWTRFTAKQLNDWKTNGTFYYENKRTNQQLPIDYQIYEDYTDNQEKLDVQKAVSAMQKPMLFIHGKEDPAVPYQAAEELHSVNTEYSQLHLCTGDHVFGRKHPWLNDYLPEETKFVVSLTIQFLQNKISCK